MSARRTAVALVASAALLVGCGEDEPSDTGASETPTVTDSETDRPSDDPPTDPTTDPTTAPNDETGVVGTVTWKAVEARMPR